MIGITNEKTALPFPATETKSSVDNLFYRKENPNRESGRTDFENYLKAATTDKSKPFRETDSKKADYQIMDRREERTDYQVKDSAKQVVKEDKSPKKDEVQSKTDDPADVSAKAPEQPVTDDTAVESEESQNAAIAGAQAISLNPGVQTPVNEVMQLTETITGIQSIDGLADNELTQLPVSVSAEELMDNQTTGETGVNNQPNSTTGQTAQNVVDELMGLTPNTNSTNGQTAATANPVMNQAMAALVDAQINPKNNSSRETVNQTQTKVTGTAENGLKETTLNSNVLEVFQDKVTAQTATQNLAQSKDELQQSLQNAANGKTVVTGAENKPLNLAVLQTQLAVGENPDKAGNVPVMPLQQQQLSGGQFQEITGTTAQTAGKDQLFTQIMDHAKLMLSGNQSELEMNLKPEHLGKLQLKVFVENQVVTARFTAESQQVKQIIETNLNELRDQLRESGLQVDHLSVSVGGGSNEQFFNQTAEGGNQSQFSSSHDSHSYKDDMSDVVAGGAVSTPKSLEDTVIDLIA